MNRLLAQYYNYKYWRLFEATRVELQPCIDQVLEWKDHDKQIHWEIEFDFEHFLRFAYGSTLCSLYFDKFCTLADFPYFKKEFKNYWIKSRKRIEWLTNIFSYINFLYNLFWICQYCTCENCEYATSKRHYLNLCHIIYSSDLICIKIMFCQQH